MANNLRTVWIVGASQGIGRAVAERFHRAGAQVIISARSAEALHELAEQLGDRVEVLPLDVTNQAALHQAAGQIYQHFGRIDSVVYMAALYQPMQLDALDLPQVQAIVRVNVEGAFNLVGSVFPIMKERKEGQIVLCASVAGYGGLPNAQPYAATKAALINLAESLYLEAQNTGVDIKVVNPAFVRTRLTEMNRFSMPALMETEQAAEVIFKGMHSRSFEIHFPRRFTLWLKVLRLLPYGLYFRVVGRLLSGQKQD